MWGGVLGVDGVSNCATASCICCSRAAVSSSAAASCDYGAARAQCCWQGGSSGGSTQHVPCSMWSVAHDTDGTMKNT
jgi:hypothetical protein